MSVIKYVDLCCGIGGFRIAIQNFEKYSSAKFECVLSADIKPDALKTYNINFNETNKPLNIFDIDEIPPFDLLCSGFPCQPFSSSGNKLGFDDARGNVIFKILKICEKYKPKYIILENVANLLTINGGATISKIVDEFKSIDYNISFDVLNSADFGVPQNRERLFIVGEYNNISTNTTTNINTPNIFKAIKKLDKVFLKNVIDTAATYTDKKILVNNLSEKLLALHKIKSIYGFKLQDKRGGDNNIHSWDIGYNGELNENERELMNKIMTERRKKHWAVSKNIDWMDGMPLTYEEIKTFYNSEFLKSMLDNLVALNYLKIEKPKKLVNRRRVYDETGKNGYNICKGKLSFPITMILNPEDISPTLTATDSSKLAVIINNTYIRYLTDNELKLLCGFPLDYIIPADVDKYDLFGNMVVPNVVEEILKKIYL